MTLRDASRALRVASDRFMETGAPPQGVRPDIAASWHRSRLAAVSPSLDLATLPQHGVDLRCRLLGAAGPVLDRLAESLDGTRTSVILTDARARILKRWTDDRSLDRSLDRVSAAPGASYDEELIGTNGLGTVIETGRAVQVAGAEHFHEGLVGFTCVGAPIRHPISNRLEGVLDLSCRFEDTNPLILPMVLEGVRSIRELLLQASSEAERALLASFIDGRKGSRPVLALNADTIITNAAADKLLAASEHDVLWDHIRSRLLSRREARGDMTLADARRVRFRAREVAVGSRVVGALVELEALDAAIPTTRVHVDAAPRLVGRSAAHRRLVGEVVRNGTCQLPLLVTGEAGAGKCTVARAVHDARGSGTCSVVDAATTLIEGCAAWLAAVQALLSRPGTLVLRNLQLLDAAGASALAALLDGSGGSTTARVVGTVTTGSEGTGSHLRPLLDRFPEKLEVPPLRARPEDVEPMVAALLARHAAAGSPRCRPDVVTLLSRHDWPGNVRELENLVRALAARRPTGDITVDDLPPELQRGAGPALSGLQLVECDAIRATLAATNGNRAEAASLLGISRSTLYRKLQAYGLDPGSRAS